MDTIDSINKFDRYLIQIMHRHGIALLRVALGIVFLWFGLLKIFDVSPVKEMIADALPFLPSSTFIFILGIWEVLIGLGFIFKISLRVVLLLMWLQMAGTLTTPFLDPARFFVGNNFLLPTLEGEFVIKNIVLIASSIAIAGHELSKEVTAKT